MKKLILTLSIAIASYFSYAQNTPSWTGSGDIGIGTSSPVANLHINGTFLIDPTGSSYNEGIRIHPSSANDYSTIVLGAVAGMTGSGAGQWSLIRYPAANNNLFGIRHYNTDYLNITSTGEVGIGTTSPSAKLDVNGNQRLNGNLIFSTDQTAYFIRGAANGGAIRLRSNGVSTSDRDVQLGNVDNNGTWNSYMTVANNGTVGIGTTNPSYNLQIEKTSSQPALMIGGGHAGSPRLQVYGLNADPNAWMGLGTDMGGGPYEHSIYFPTAPSGYTGKLTIGDYNGSTYNTRMTVLNNGNIGIGTLSPSVKLDVQASTYAANFQNTAASNTPVVSIQQLNAGGNNVAQGLHIDARSVGSALDIVNNTASLFRVKTNGNVGIGTTSPDEKLTVNGTIHSKEVKVDNNVPVPDYVFEPEYKLRSLEQLKKYVDENHHLPEIPSAKEIEKNGIQVGDMSMKLLKTIEELTLHVIELNNQVKLQNQKINNLENQLKK